MQFVFFTDRDKLFVLINKLGITVVNGFKEYKKNAVFFIMWKKCAKKEWYLLKKLDFIMNIIISALCRLIVL